MTAREFEKAYAQRSGITVTELRAMHRVVRPCNCGADACEGWQSLNVAYATDGERWQDWNPDKLAECLVLENTPP
jgi:hypothetical protein